MLLQSHKSLVGDLTTESPTPANSKSSDQQLAAMSTECGVCHLVMQATPSAKGVACATIRYCCKRDSDVCILLYIEERPILSFVSIISV